MDSVAPPRLSAVGKHSPQFAPTLTSLSPTSMGSQRVGLPSKRPSRATGPAASWLGWTPQEFWLGVRDFAVDAFAGEFGLKLGKTVEISLDLRLPFAVRP